MMAAEVVGVGVARRMFDLMTRARLLLMLSLLLGVSAGVIGLFGLSVDMSFRPVFTADGVELDQTGRFESTFGRAGFNELTALVDVGDAHDVAAMLAVADLAQHLRTVPHVTGVRDPLTFPYVDDRGKLHPDGAAADLAAARSADGKQAVLRSVTSSPTARRIVFGDGDHRVAVTARLDLGTSDFRTWRSADREFRQVVDDWAARNGTAVMVTGYPDVEQVYAHEVLTSVLRSIGVLIVAMVAVLFAYFRRIRDVVICLAGITLAIPLVFGAMRLLDQPFSIVNSQVLTLVAIVGIAEALHHQQEYRRRREAGRDHAAANREAFSILLWPAFMTGLATVAAFAALVTADMHAIWSFGLCTSLGVAIVYLVNWITVPALVDLFYRNSDSGTAVVERSWTLSVLMATNRFVQRRPAVVVVTFLTVSILAGIGGVARLSVDQKVNQELPQSHPAVAAQSAYEHEFSGFLGPDLWIWPGSQTIVGEQNHLARLVARLCAMPEVRYVASPLDLVGQPPVTDARLQRSCERYPGDLQRALAARSGLAGPGLQAMAEHLVSPDGSQAAVLVRVGDMGTGKSIDFAYRVLAVAHEELPGADIRLVGQWWLAQQGMRSLSVEMMMSAATALLLVLPVMWFAIRDRRLFVAALVPTVLPILAALGFMGLAGITVRIGTAMILAISLGLAADDTIHLSVRIRDRVRAGSDPASAVTAVIQRTGRPASFSSYVLIIGFSTMMLSSLVALRDMGVVAAFTMAFALLTDMVLGPAIYLLLMRRQGDIPDTPDVPGVGADKQLTTAS